MAAPIFTGTSGNDTITGTKYGDIFNMGQGGADTVDGALRNDVINAGGAFSLDDAFNGGAGTDTLHLQGDYSAGLAISTTMMSSFDTLILDGDFVYSLVVADGVAPPGPDLQLVVDAAGIGGTGSLTFDGSAETDGRFLITASVGDDTLIGGGGRDFFDAQGGGSDVFVGGAGDDTFSMHETFDSTDRIDGGAGSDSLNLVVSGGVVLGAQSIKGIEKLGAGAGSLTMNDGNVAAGDLLTVYATNEGTASGLNFNGSAETDGRFTILGGDASDVIRSGRMDDTLDGGHRSDKLMAGAGADILIGGLSGDFLYGGAGNDRFAFEIARDSTVAGADWIRDWNDGDRIDLAPVDANVNVAGNQAFTYIGASAFTAAGQLQVTTTASGNTLVRADLTGDRVADFEIKVAGLPDLGAGSFIL